MLQKFEVCVSTPDGWAYHDVEIDIPDEIREIEDVLRSGLSLPAGNEGKVKKFWKKVGENIEIAFDISGTWFLRPAPAGGTVSVVVARG